MRSIKYVLFVLAFVAGAQTATHAGLDVDAVPAGSGFELVVMEAPGCIYCTIFRRDVLPSYQASEHARDVPIRFVDINEPAAAAIHLDQPVDVVPTFIIVKDHKEIGRIPGYVGPENFFHAINYLLSSSP